jgi:hypothetical protein
MTNSDKEAMVLAMRNNKLLSCTKKALQKAPELELALLEYNKVASKGNTKDKSSFISSWLQTVKTGANKEGANAAMIEERDEMNKATRQGTTKNHYIVRNNVNGKVKVGPSLLARAKLDLYHDDSANQKYEESTGNCCCGETESNEESG